MSLIKHWPARYGLAVLGVLGAVWLRWALEPLIGTSTAYITVFPAMMLVAVTLGAGPGLASAALGIALVEWFFIGPRGIEPSLAVLARASILLSTSAYVGWVSTRLRLSRAQAESQSEHFRNQSELMDHADEALIVRELGGVIRFWNQGAASLYGWPASEALGQRTYELLRTEGVAVAEKDAQLTKTGHWKGELTHTGRDGRRVIVESRQTATHAADGHLMILESDRDITARTQAEAARQKFVSLANQSTEFIGICDMQYRPFYVNDAGLRLVGLERLEQACNMPVPEFFFPEDRRFITEDFFPLIPKCLFFRINLLLFVLLIVKRFPDIFQFFFIESNIAF
jgi:PAS domain S-box-containing protein